MQGMEVLQNQLSHQIESDDQPVKIRVNLGKLNRPAYMMLRNPNGTIFNGGQSFYPLGVGRSIKGKHSLLSITILDGNEELDQDGLLIEISNGKAIKTYRQMVKLANDALMYMIRIDHL